MDDDSSLHISKNDIEILEIENFIKQNQAEKVVVPKINLENIEKYQDLSFEETGE